MIAFLIILFCQGCSPLSIDVAIGGAYFPNNPKDRLTGDEQFNVSIEIKKPVTENILFISGWNHYSNGAGLGIGRFPNHGLDIIGAKLEYKLQL